jgi:hypothetical protein
VTVAVDEFNGKIAGIVRARSETGRKVGVVDMGFLAKEDLSDGIHLNEGGNGKIARAWFRGIEGAVAKGWIGVDS